MQKKAYSNYKGSDELVNMINWLESLRRGACLGGRVHVVLGCLIFVPETLWGGGGREGGGLQSLS